MDILIKEEFELRKDDIIDKIESGALFIHPTDTIYGIGCNALLSSAVKKVREIKGRPKTPFSVIAPSKQWIFDNHNITKEGEKWIKKLPAPLTLILKRKNTKLAEEVAPGINTLGIRIPNHWFSDFVHELGFPVVTTSANIVGENFMTSLDDLDPKIKQCMAFIVYEDKKKGRPSKVIDLTDGKKVIKR